MMLECLPDRCVPDYTLQSPQTVSGFDPDYTADVQILAKFAHSAQEIIRDIGDHRRDPPTSLIDFGSEDFFNALGPTVRLYNYDCMSKQRPFFVRIHKLIEDFDRQCYDAVHRLRQCTSRKSSAYTHHATSSNSPPIRKDASVSVPNQDHPPHMHFGRRGGRTHITAGNQPFNFSGVPSTSDPFALFKEFLASNKEDNDDVFSQSMPSVKKPFDRGRKRNADGSSSSKRYSAPSHGPKLPSIRRSETRPLDRREAQRSATYQPSPEAKPRSRRPSETMPVDRMRSGNPVPLTSSNLKNMKAHSNISDSSSESDSEITKENHPPPRPLPPERKTAFGISSAGQLFAEWEPSQPYSKESHRTSERPSMSFRGVQLSSQQSSHRSELFGEAPPNDKVRKTFKYSQKTSDDDKPRQSSSKDPPQLQVPIRSDVSSSAYQATLSRPSQPNSASETICAAFFDFHSEYSVECAMFKQLPPLDEDDRKKCHTRLSEMILQHVLLKLDAVETEDEVLKNKKKQLIVDAQNALEQLDSVMKAT